MADDRSLEDRIEALKPFDLAILFGLAEHPRADVSKLRGLRGWRVRRAVRRLLAQGLLHEEAPGRYVAQPEAGPLVRAAVVAEEIGTFMPEHLAQDREWAAGRRRGRWPDP
jgi:hypothetical protein